MDSHKPTDLYTPRKCTITGRLIHPKDHASIQLNVAEVDANGVYTGDNRMYPVSGFVRSMGEADDSLNNILQKDGFLQNVWSYQQ